MTSYRAVPASAGLRGSPRVPGDKSISHRSLLLSASARGTSTITGLSAGDDVARTETAVQQFGAGIERAPDGTLAVTGGDLHEPAGVVDVGNSGTAIRLLAGWAASVEGITVLAGDESVARRPMDRVAEPLRLMGAEVDGRQGGRYPPLVVRGGRLKGIDYRPPVPSAQVKSAVLLAGIAADGHTTVREDLPTRAHTEEMLALCGADITVSDGAVTVRPSVLKPVHFEVPADPSQAAFWLVGACITPGSDVTVERVYVGRARAGFLDVLRRMGADIDVLDEDPAASTATLRARHAQLRATDVGGREVPSLIDEIPALAVAAAYADGRSTFTDAAELKVKESDRISTTVAALRSIGAQADPLDDGLAVEGTGGAPLAGGTVDSAGDHRIAMSMAIAALAASAPVLVEGWDSVATSYPGFEQEYARCAS